MLSKAEFKLTILLLFLVPTPNHASQPDFQSAFNEDVRPRPIESPLLSAEELETHRQIIPHITGEDLTIIRNSYARQLKVLIDGFTTSQENRFRSMASWLNFHNCFAGKSKGGGYAIIGLSAAGWIVSLTPLPPEVKNWLAIASTIAGAGGGFLVYLGSKSQEAGLRLEQSFAANITRTQHAQTLYYVESQRRGRLAEIEEDRLPPHNRLDALFDEDGGSVGKGEELQILVEEEEVSPDRRQGDDKDKKDI